MHPKSLFRYSTCRSHICLSHPGYSLLWFNRALIGGKGEVVTLRTVRKYRNEAESPEMEMSARLRDCGDRLYLAEAQLRSVL